MASTAEHRLKLLDYLANTDNEIPYRRNYATILGISSAALYTHFKTADLADIEMEALASRRKQYALTSMRVDKATEQAALEGSAADRKLYYQKHEGWSEQVKVDASGPVEIKINKPGG